MTFLKAARIAALVTGSSALLAATPSLAQRAPAGNNRAQAPTTAPAANVEQQQLTERFKAMPRGEQTAFAPLINAAVTAAQAKAKGETPNWAPVQAAMPAAQAAAKSNHAKFFLARIQLEMAVDKKDVAAQEQALTALIANPLLTPAEVTENRRMQSVLLNKRAEQLFAANDFAGAERIFRQLLEGNPNDTRLLNNIRITQERQGNTAGAAQGLEQQILAAETGGQRAPEALYQRAWQVPYRANNRAEALKNLHRLVRAYPTPANWRSLLAVVQERARDDDQIILDGYRFGRVAKVLEANQYVALAGALDRAGLPGEAKALIDEAVAAGAVQASQGEVGRVLREATGRIPEDRQALPGQVRQARSASGGRQARLAADALAGYGRYGEAAELYRLALSKGGDDANLINTRLGATLAMAGQRAEAEAALRAVTGPRAELAALWLLWLERNKG